MSNSQKIKNRANEILSLAFTRSISNLGIDPVRFRSLGYHQRRLALLEAISSTAGTLAKHGGFLPDRSEFFPKSLSDFSPEEIGQHQTLLDGFIALSCLGEKAYIKPLITYFGFPEIRWRIIIEPVLRAIVSKNLDDPVYRLPSDTELYEWKLWILKQPSQNSFRDLSSLLVEETGEVIKERQDTMPHELPGITSVVLGEDVMKLSWKFFSSNQFDFCQNRLIPAIRSKNTNEFIFILDEFLREKSRDTQHDTLVAGIKDCFSYNYSFKVNLKKNLLSLRGDEIKPHTWAILYQSLVSSSKDNDLAAIFAKKIGGESENADTTKAIINIINKSTGKNSIQQIAKILSQGNSLLDNEWDALIDLKPLIGSVLKKWIVTFIFDELESIRIIGSEKPSRRKPLSDLVIILLENNNHILYNVSILTKSPDPSYKEFGDWINKLYTQRNSIFTSMSAGLSETPKTFLYVYKKLLLDWESNTPLLTESIQTKKKNE